VSRRAFLAGGAGVSMMVAFPDVTFAGPTRAAAGPAAGSAAGRFFLYGTTEAGANAAVHGWRSPARAGLSDLRPSTIATDLAALPVRSQDGATVAVSTVEMTGSGAVVTVTLMGTEATGTEASATVDLPGVPPDALVLVTPVFAAGSSTVAVVMAVSVPSYGGMFTKSGLSTQVRSTSWTTSHQLAYLDRACLKVTGPFDLGNTPSMAWTDTVADANNLYVWTMREPAASGATKANPLLVSPPQLMAFPLGSGKPGLSLRSSGAWPSGRQGLVLKSADVVRLVDGRDLEVFSPKSGKLTRVAVSSLDIATAKPGATNVHLRPDGTLVVANAAMGRAVVVDPEASYATTQVINYARPAIPLGGPDAKTALSADGTVLFTLGAADAGGVNAYDIATGSLLSAYSNGAHYAGIYRLPSGSLLAVNGLDPKPQLSFFSESLASLGSSATNMYVSEVF
jgi:hypothetical protein